MPCKNQNHTISLLSPSLLSIILISSCCLCHLPEHMFSLRYLWGLNTCYCRCQTVLFFCFSTSVCREMFETRGVGTCCVRDGIISPGHQSAPLHVIIPSPLMAFLSLSLSSSVIMGPSLSSLGSRSLFLSSHLFLTVREAKRNRETAGRRTVTPIQASRSLSMPPSSLFHKILKWTSSCVPEPDNE